MSQSNDQFFMAKIEALERRVAALESKQMRANSMCGLCGHALGWGKHECNFDALPPGPQGTWPPMAVQAIADRQKMELERRRAIDTRHEPSP